MRRAPLFVPAAILSALIASGSGRTAAQETPQVPPQLQPREPGPGMQAFRNRAQSFRVDLPDDWRQLAPGEVLSLRRAVTDLPHDLRENEPALFYGVGPVDRWLAGTFDGVYLYVVEQDAEWHLEGDLRERLQHMWDHKGEHDGIRYEVLSATKTEIGPDLHPAVLAERRISPVVGRTQHSLDVHVPTGGRELTLCFVSWDENFATAVPTFRAAIDTMTFARRSRGELTLSDRLWTPVLAGAAVGLVLLLLYRRSRRPPVSVPRT